MARRPRREGVGGWCPYLRATPGGVVAGVELRVIRRVVRRVEAARWFQRRRQVGGGVRGAGAGRRGRDRGRGRAGAFARGAGAGGGQGWGGGRWLAVWGAGEWGGGRAQPAARGAGEGARAWRGRLVGLELHRGGRDPCSAQRRQRQ